MAVGGEGDVKICGIFTDKLRLNRSGAVFFVTVIVMNFTFDLSVSSYHLYFSLPNKAQRFMS